MPAAFDTVIVGAGNAGVSLAARLRRDGVGGIALIDPSPVHRYRPMLNYAAAGQARMSRYERAMATVVPDGVELVPHAATRVDPDARTVTLDSGASVSYRDLVLCPGLTPHWEEIPGLQEAYVDGWAVSAHVPEYAGRACAALVREREGTVVFSVPPEPASCGGTVLKAMFLACDRWRRAEVLDRIDVHLVTPFGGLLGLEKIDSRLQPFIEDYGITVHADTRVTAVDHAARTVSLDGPAPVPSSTSTSPTSPRTAAHRDSSPTRAWRRATPPRSSRWTPAPCATRATRRCGDWGTPRPWTPARPVARCATRSRWWPTTCAPPATVSR